MTQQKHEDVWLGSIMPSGWSSAHSNHSCEPLELHKVRTSHSRSAVLAKLTALHPHAQKQTCQHKEHFSDDVKRHA